MRVRILGLLLTMVVHAGDAMAQEFYEDKGNICLAQCGVFTDGGLDLAAPYVDGNWHATAVYPRCLETCEGHAIGIDYFSSDYCDHGDSVENDSRVALLVRAAPGAAIFGTSCAGRLVQLNLPRQTQAVKPMMSARSSRNPGQVEIGMGR